MILFASIAGQILEFYDFMLFVFFAKTIASIFFPAQNPDLSLLFIYGVFGLSFMARPFGALFFGYWGDKLGRKPVFLVTVIGMGFSTLMIAFLPGYSEWGIISPLLLIISRMMQGFCIGGEFNGGVIFVLEHYPKKGGLWGGIIFMAVIGGLLFANLSFLIVEWFPEIPFLWRIPFLMGGIFGVASGFFRRFIHETESFKKIIPSKKGYPIKKIFSILWNFHSLLIFIVGALLGNLFYTTFVFLNGYIYTYLEVLGEKAHLLNPIFLVVAGVCSVLSGWISDYIPKMLYMVSACILIIIGHIFLVSHFSPSWDNLIQIYLFLSIVMAIFIAPCYDFMQQLTIPETRFLSIAVPFNLGISLVGGIAPFLNLLAFQFFESFTFMTGLMAVLAIVFSLLVLIESSHNPQKYNL